MNIRTLVFALATAGLACGAAVPAAAQTVYTWTGAASNNYNDDGNWADFVPQAQFAEVGRINNGGTAVVSDVPPATGGLQLGFAAADSGTLTIQSGGHLTAEPGISGAISATGNVNVGVSGLGTLNVQAGGALTATTLTSGGQPGSSINLFGNASVTASSTTLNRITNITGPNVNFTTANSLAIGSASVLTANITAATHSPLKAAQASINGTLNVNFSGYTPTLGNRWTIVDAGNSAGTFASVNVSGFPGMLASNQAFRVSQRTTGANRAVTEVVYDELLVLKVDRGGGISITKPGSSTTGITGYAIDSAVGSLSPTGWSSFADQGNAGWSEANPSTTGLAELKSNLPAKTVGANAAFSLGNAYAPDFSVFGNSVEDLKFQYYNSLGELVTGIVEYEGQGYRNNLVLSVDSAGFAQLENNSPTTVSLIGYDVFSPSSSLDGAGWNSLDEQNLADWTASPATAGRIAELKPTSATVLSPGTILTLGHLFNNTSGTQDLQFSFLLDGAAGEQAGIVRYGALEQLSPVGNVAGDYNGDGTVNAADYTIWRDRLGQSFSLTNENPAAATPGVVDQEDYVFWKNRFGATTGTGSGGIVGGPAVPEPSTLALLGVAAFCFIGRHARR